ncbi:MAG TPA: Ig-like domain-containing protein [Candidatus Saccharimonadales bacterium]|nr:Ig-like domain-containing protein [Candidatus Saccharimonadales bacterium]
MLSKRLVRLYKNTQKKVISISTAAILVASSLGGALPVLMGKAFAQVNGPILSNQVPAAGATLSAGVNTISIQADPAGAGWSMTALPADGVTYEIDAIADDCNQVVVAPTALPNVGDIYSTTVDTSNLSIFPDTLNCDVSHPTSTVEKYTVQFVGTDSNGATTKTNTAISNNLHVQPAVPSLVAPADTANTNANPVTFSWNSAAGATGYKVQIATDAGFTNIIANPATASTSVQRSLSDGTYYWRVRATRSNTATSAFSTARSFTVDTSAPTVNITSPSNNALVSGNGVSVGYSVSDNDLSSYSLTMDGITVQSGTANGSYTYSLNTTLFSDGSHTLVATGIDAASNTTQSTVNITIDNTAPNIAITNLGSGDIVSGNSVKVKGLASDATSGLASSQVNVALYPVVAGVCSAVASTSQIASVGGNGHWNATFDSTALTDGQYCVTASGSDVAGNPASDTVNYIVVDNTKPVVNISSPIDGTTVKQTVSVNGSVSDATSGVATSGYTITNASSTVVATSAAPFSWDTTAVADGVYTVTLSATDNAGNQASTSVSVTVDNTAPVVTVDQQGTVTGDNTPTLTGTVDDNNATVKVKINGNVYTATVGGGVWSVTVPNIDHLSDGNYNIGVKATDEVANFSTATGSIVIDVHAPGTPTILTPLLQTANSTPTISWLPGLNITHPVVTYTVEVADNSGFSSPTTYTTTSLSQVSNPLADGTYYARVMGTDALGGTSSWSNTRQFTVDTTAPTVSITSPSDGDYVHGTITASGLASDSGTGLLGYSWKVKDSSNNTVLSDPHFGSVSDLTWDTTTVADGDYTITLTAADQVLNSDHDTITVHVDNTAPVVTVDQQSTFTNDTTPTISGTASDDNLDTVDVTVTGGAYTRTYSNVTVTGGVWSFDSADVLADGNYTVSATATDLAGNSSSAAGSFTVDANPPTVPTVNGPANGIYTNNDLVNFSWNASTGPNTPLSYEIQIDNDGSFTAPSVDQTQSGTSYLTTLSDGYYCFHVQAIDNLGGQSGYSGTNCFTVDTTDPTVNITNPSNGDYINGSVHVKFNVNDLNLNDYKLSVDGNNVKTGSNNGNHTYDLDTTALSDGSHTITLKARDLAGNKASTSITVTVDNTAPDAYFTHPNNGKYVNGTINVKYYVNDTNLEGYKLFLDGSKVDQGTGNGNEVYSFDTTTVSDGTHTFTLVAKDLAGNKTTATLDLIVDNTAPTAGFTWPTPSDGAWLNNDFGVGFWAHDNISLKHVKVTLIDHNSNKVRTCYNNHNLSGHHFWTTCGIGLGSLADGKYSLVLFVEDHAGNKNTYYRTIHIDRTSPVATITSPSDGSYVGGTVNLAGNITEKHPKGYSWKVVDTSNNKVFHVHGHGAGSVSASWDTTTVPDGTYAIVLTGRDKAGNIGQDSVIVNVDNTAPTDPVASPAGGTYTGNQTVTLTSTDASGTQQIYYTTDGTTPTCSSTLYTGAITVSSNLTIKAIACDSVGNTSGVTVESYVINHPVPQVVTTTSSSSNGGQGGGSDNGNVLGEKSNDNGQTSSTNTDQSNTKHAKKSNNFLGLGWWWLLVLAALLGGWWFLFGRRRNDEDEE